MTQGSNIGTMEQIADSEGANHGLREPKLGRLGYD
jgi:hypothetical protein